MLIKWEDKMRKAVYTLILLLVFCLVSEAVSTDLVQEEEEGLETRTLTITTSQVRTMRDIPEGGLLLIPDSQNDRVMAFNPITGDIYEENFIPPDPTNLSTPIQAALHPDENSIIVSDQLKDGLLEYDLDGNFIGWFAPAGGVNNAILDNVRGWGLKADGNILVSTAGGSNTDAIVEFDTSGNNIGNFIANGAGGLDGPWDILYRPDHSDYLVTASSSGGIHRYDMNGLYLGDFATGFSFTEQITETESGNILIASFSAPSGVHEYASDGTFVGYYDVVTSLRGVYELPNGNILVTNSGGVYEINRNNTIVSTKISGVNARSIDFVEPVSPFPPPTNVSVDGEIGTVYWDPPEMGLIRDLIGYNVYLDGIWQLAVGVDVFSYNYQGLIPGQTYIAGVSALYDEGESEIVTVEFIYSYPPIFAPPENLVAIVINYNEVYLAWEVPIGNNRALSGYRVYRNQGEIAEVIGPYTLTYIDDEGLDTGDYDYYVTAVYSNPAGESVPSNIAGVEIILPIPQNVEAVFSYPNIIVTWDPISDSRDLVCYNIYIDEELHAGGITSTMFIIDYGSIPPGMHILNVTAEYTGGWESEFSNDVELWGPNSSNDILPLQTELNGNYPNPFNPTTIISYSLKENSKVSLNIYNIKGAVVRTLVDSEMNAAYHEIIWNGKDDNGKQVGSGVYFYKMKAEKYTATKKMILMK
jgi:hypothetical protein